SAADYAKMAALIPQITHLPPPGHCGPISLDSFSPHFNAARQFGLCRVRPHRAYRYVFPRPPEELEQLAYFFEFDYAEARDVASYAAPLVREVERWWALQSPSVPAGRRPALDLTHADAGVLVTDTRPGAARKEQRLSGLSAAIYLACDAIQTPRSLKRQLAGRADEAAIEATLAALL